MSGLFSSKKNAKAEPESVSTLSTGTHVTGNVICPGRLEVHGKVDGDIHTNTLAIYEGAAVEGKMIAQTATIQGKFRGTIHSNTVKLTRTAVVDGEIYTKSLAIEQNAEFEGVSRKLDKPIEAVGTKSATVTAAVAATTSPSTPPVTNGHAAPLNGTQSARAVN